PSLLKIKWDGADEADTKVVLTGDGDGAFLFPNDLAFGPDGALYMTDSGVDQAGWRAMTHEERVRQGADGRLYRIDLEKMSVEKLDSGLAFANGIAFGPDDAIYVSTTLDGKVYRYEWNDGEVGSRELFGDLLDPAKSDVEGLRGGDGMAFGEDGNLYCAVVGQGDVTVLGPARSLTASSLPGLRRRMSLSGRMARRRSTSRSRASATSRCTTCRPRARLCVTAGHVWPESGFSRCRPGPGWRPAPGFAAIGWRIASPGLPAGLLATRRSLLATRRLPDAPRRLPSTPPFALSSPSGRLRSVRLREAHRCRTRCSGRR
ncbi:MAG: SMP-30/gluconolactonase/LRE family protein, partial [Chloroflexi bacterium]|nr:SMP-30/gluconolactonase/LRE family protein [Chloroflexota bacterium]